MKKLSLCLMILLHMFDLYGMELWNSNSSGSSRSNGENNSLPGAIAQTSRNQLINAIVADNETGVMFALINGIDINAAGKKYGQDDPPLCVAAGLGLRTILESLLANGAQPDVPDGNGDTALHYAVRFGHLQVAKVLLESNAYLEAKNMWGQTVLHEALDVTPLKYDIIKWLIKKGAQVNAQDDEGNSPAHYAYMHDRDDVLDLLDACDDVDWDLKNEDGLKPNEMPLLAYYVRPPPPPPLPEPEQRTIVYTDLDELFGYFFTQKKPAPQEPHDTESCLPSLQVLDDAHERPIAVSSNDDQEDSSDFWDSE